MRTPGVPSGTSLLGLVRHLAHVERFTFLGEDVADRPATFRPTDDDTVDSVLTAYRDPITRADERIARTGLTGHPPRPTRRGGGPTLR